MSRWTGAPAYQQVASEYRTKILEGELPPGSKLPSETELMREFEVSRMVAKMAIRVLKHEGLIFSHPGKGSFVKDQQRLVRETATRYLRKAASPFESDTEKAKRNSDWDYVSHEVKASKAVGQRLNVAPGDPVMETRYRYYADDKPVQLSTSWEPLAITKGTPIERPEESIYTGVIPRMDSIGHPPTHVIERVTARAALPEEVTQLELPDGAYVLLIARTYYENDTPLETCDIIFPGDRYELTYQIPVQ